MREQGSRWMVGEPIDEVKETEYEMFVQWLLQYCDEMKELYWLAGFKFNSHDQYIDTLPGSAGYGFRSLYMSYTGYRMDGGVTCGRGKPWAGLCE